MSHMIASPEYDPFPSNRIFPSNMKPHVLKKMQEYIESELC